MTYLALPDLRLAVVRIASRKAILIYSHAPTIRIYEYTSASAKADQVSRGYSDCEIGI